MRLCNLQQFRQIFFAPDSAPSTATLRTQIKAGKLPGVILGGRYYVDLDEFDRITSLRAKLEAQLEEFRSNPLLEGLL